MCMRSDITIPHVTWHAFRGVTNLAMHEPCRERWIRVDRNTGPNTDCGQVRPVQRALQEIVTVIAGARGETETAIRYSRVAMGTARSVSLHKAAVTPLARSLRAAHYAPQVVHDRVTLIPDTKEFDS